MAAKGKCGYLALSTHLFGTSSKYRTVRNAGAKQLEMNKEKYKDRVNEGDLEKAIKGMKKKAYVDALEFSAVADAYGREIEMWRRTKDGHDIESDFAFPISDRSLILWYNGQDGEGNHYDALLVVDEEKFRGRASNCSRLNNLPKKEDPNSSQLSLDWIGGVPMDDDGPAPDGSNSRAEATRPPQVNEVITSTPTTLTRGGNSNWNLRGRD